MLNGIVGSSTTTPSPATGQVQDASTVHVARTEMPPLPLPAINPYTVWGPALVALFGVLITLTVKWFQDRRAARHDLRRELFLKVTDAITDMGELFGVFGIATTSLEDLSARFSRCIRPLSQAEIVANDQLLAALSALKIALGLAFGELIRMRIPMEKHLADIATNMPLIDDASAEIKLVLAEQARLSLDGVRTSEERARFQRLIDRFNYFSTVRDEHFAADLVSRNAMQSVVARISERAVQKQRQMIDEKVRVLALVRKELGFRFNVDAYMKTNKAMAEVATADFGKTVDEVNEAFRNDAAS